MMPASCWRLQCLLILIALLAPALAETGNTQLGSLDADEDVAMEVIFPDSTKGESDGGLATVDTSDGATSSLLDKDSSTHQQRGGEELGLKDILSDDTESSLEEIQEDGNGNEENPADRPFWKKTLSDEIGIFDVPIDAAGEIDASGEVPAESTLGGLGGEANAADAGVDGETVRGNSEDSAAGETVRDGFITGWRSSEVEGGMKEGTWRQALASYDGLLKENYLVLSFIQATALGVVGDTVAQLLERRWRPGQRFDWTRTAHAGTLNMIIDGVLTPRWYNLLDLVNEDRTLPVAFGKAMAASLIYGPFANGLFLAGARALRQGLKTRFDWTHWRHQLLVCTVRDLEMWPPLHLLGFWLLPKHWRPVVTHAVGVALLAVITATGFDGLGGQSISSALPLLLRWARRKRDPPSPGSRSVG